MALEEQIQTHLKKKNKILIDSNKICMKTNKSALCFLAASPPLEATTVPPLVQAPHALLNSGQHPSRSLAGLAHLLCIQNHGSNLHLVLLVHKQQFYYTLCTSKLQILQT